MQGGDGAGESSLGEGGGRVKDSWQPEHWRHLRKAGEMPLVDKGRRGVERLGRRAEARLAKAEDLGSFCDITELNSFCR